MLFQEQSMKSSKDCLIVIAWLDGDYYYKKGSFTSPWSEDRLIIKRDTNSPDRYHNKTQ